MLQPPPAPSSAMLTFLMQEESRVVDAYFAIQIVYLIDMEGAQARINEYVVEPALSAIKFLV